MAASRTSPALVTAATLALVAAAGAAIVIYRSASTSKKSGSNGAATDSARSAMTGRDQDEAGPSPLTLAPAMTGHKALVVCVEGSEEASIAASWASESRGAGAAVSVCPPSFVEQHAKGATSTYDSVVVEGGEEGLDDSVLGLVLKLLKAGGTISVVLEGAKTDTTVTNVTVATVKRSLTFAGFVGVAPSKEDARVFQGQRVAWEAGASAPVRLSFAKPAANGNGAVAPPVANGVGNGIGSAKGGEKKTWKLALDDDDGDGVFGAGGGDDDDDDLVDEDALLDASAPVKRANESDAGGCATKRRACKDCSCGRAEMEGNGDAPRPVVSVGDVDDALTSACGNCSKGDAFRCGGCPFLGKPAFEKGQEKLIMLSDLDSQQDE